MKDATNQVIALGGGGFSSDTDDSALDRYILEQAPVSNPAVCFVPTASGDSEIYIRAFYAAYSQLDCRSSHLMFFDRTPDLRSVILAQDVIYVGGGNTKSMLGVWREWGLADLLEEAWMAGVVMAGVSAGAICWFEQGLTDSHAEELAVLDCMGFVAGSCSPHYDGEVDRRPSYHRFLSEGRVNAGYAMDDGAALHVIHGEFHAAISSRPKAGVYRVRSVNGRVVEEPLETRLISE